MIDIKLVLLISTSEVFIFIVILQIQKQMTSVKEELLERKAEGKTRNLEEPQPLRVRKGEVRKQ